MNREIRSDVASMSEDVLLTSFEMVANYRPHLECADEKNLIKNLIIHYGFVTEKKKKKSWQEYCTWDGIKRGTKSIMKSIIQLMSGNCASTHAPPTRIQSGSICFYFWAKLRFKIEINAERKVTKNFIATWRTLWKKLIGWHYIRSSGLHKH